MFYFKESKNPKLEVSIETNYSEADLLSVLLNIEGLVDNPKMPVIFIVNPTIQEHFKEMIEKNSWFSFYRYHIQ